VEEGEEAMTELMNESLIDLLNSVGESKGTSAMLISRLHTTRKKFYSRMGHLVKSGLITRNGSKTYKLTTFGEIMNNLTHEMISLEQQRWKLQALDSSPVDIKSKVFKSLFNEAERTTILQRLKYGDLVK
jgi:predicted transcriptional regulator